MQLSVLLLVLSRRKPKIYYNEMTFNLIFDSPTMTEKWKYDGKFRIGLVFLYEWIFLLNDTASKPTHYLLKHLFKNILFKIWSFSTVWTSIILHDCLIKIETNFYRNKTNFSCQRFSTQVYFPSDSGAEPLMSSEETSQRYWQALNFVIRPSFSQKFW